MTPRTTPPLAIALVCAGLVAATLYVVVMLAAFVEAIYLIGRGGVL